MKGADRQFTRRNALRAGIGVGLASLWPAPPGHVVHAKDRDASAKDSGFKMPPESSPHLRTFMQWPARAAIYGNSRELKAVRGTIATIAKAINRFEPVVMLARDNQIAGARVRLGPNIDIWPMPVDDLWCRDSGPTFVRSPDGDLAISDLNFNGWGKKQSFAGDGKIAARIARKLGLHRFDSGVVGESGGVEFDGEGTLLAHESSWVASGRSTLARDEIERRLLHALGGQKMIWAPGRRGADITDYHIDSLARFVEPGVVLIQLPERPDPNDPWSAAALETHEILKFATDANGRKLEIITLNEPVRIRADDPEFVASYANYYVCNGAVIGAEFGDDKADTAAHALLAELHPDRQIVMLNVDPLGFAGGGIHCATQQQPLAG